MKNELVEHHIHYKEIDGYDETIMMSRSDHRLLHIRRRKEGKCNIPSKELEKISNAAYSRTAKRKIQNNITSKKYNSTEIGKFNKRNYVEKNIQRIKFNDVVCTNIRHIEQIEYNTHTGFVSVVCFFEARKGKLLKVNI